MGPGLVSYLTLQRRTVQITYSIMMKTYLNLVFQELSVAMSNVACRVYLRTGTCIIILLASIRRTDHGTFFVYTDDWLSLWDWTGSWLEA